MIALTVCHYSHSLLQRAKPLLHSLDALESFIPYFITVRSIVIHRGKVCSDLEDQQNSLREGVERNVLPKADKNSAARNSWHICWVSLRQPRGSKGHFRFHSFIHHIIYWFPGTEHDCPRLSFQETHSWGSRGGVKSYVAQPGELSGPPCL